MELSIIITHHQTVELLNFCLQSVFREIKNFRKEVLVVDSQTSPTTQAFLAEKYPQVKLLPFTENVGYAKIVNAGLKKARGRFILILNADIIIEPGAVQAMMDYLRVNKEVGLVGPQLLDFTDQLQASAFAYPDLRTILSRRTFFGQTRWGHKQLKRFFKYSTSQKATEVDSIQGSAMMLSRSNLDKVGLFDERFFMYFEDVDWCRRFWQAGLKIVYLPQAKMIHYYHRSSKRLGALLDLIFNKHARIHIVSAIKYFWKYRGKNYTN